MIKLYTFPPSTNSRKVRIALLEKGLEFERVNIDLSKREQKNPEYLKIHPFGQVPALDDEGFVIYDSTVINEYLEDEYPYPALMPEDSEGREQQTLSRRKSRLLARQVRDGQGVEKGPPRLSEDLATEEIRATDDVLAR